MPKSIAELPDLEYALADVIDSAAIAQETFTRLKGYLVPEQRIRLRDAINALMEVVYTLADLAPRQDDNG